jgi:asparagine synthase (glutamine-hydrolysing)
MGKVLLQYNKGINWHSNETCHARGYLYDPEGHYYEGEALLTYFCSALAEEELQAKVSEANGLFSLVIELNGTFFLAQDIVRSLPLFYSKINAEWYVSDSAWNLKGLRSDTHLDTDAEQEFMGTGYVTGKETLLEGICQVQAGEIVKLSNDPQGRFYFSYRANHVFTDSYAELRRRAVRVFEGLSQRLIIGIRNRTVALPLSGGFDSRLLAVMLKKAGYNKVVCFTYGRAGNPELEISKEVAARLGYEWIFIEYTPELLDDFMDTDDFRKYVHQGSNLTSMFYLQEYFAVKYLKEHMLVPGDSVFLPGHSGDFLGGSQFTKHHFSALDEPMGVLVNRILKIKYEYRAYDRNGRKRMKERIRRSIEEKELSGGDFAYSIHEDWDMKEKLSKFNFNSASIYTFFDYAFMAPYWDRELVEFFRNLPVSLKKDKKLYDDILVNDYFAPYEVNFPNELQEEKPSKTYTSIKNGMKKILPPPLVERMVKKLDILSYYEITASLLKDLEHRGIDIKFYGNRYNTIIIRWYLEEVKRQLF